MNQQIAKVDNIFKDRSLISRFNSKGDLRWAVEGEFARQIVTKSAKLKKCTEDSIRDSLLNVQMMGLSLNPQLGYVTLIPREVGEEPNKFFVCTINVMYKGLVHRVTSSGAMRSVQAKVVYANEPHEIIEGTNPEIRHRVITDPRSRGAMIGAYCIARTQDGELLIEWMDKEQIERVRKKSENPSGPYSPWTNYPEEMWKKTVVRRAYKYWPSSADNKMAEIISAMNNIEPSVNVEPKDVSRETIVLLSQPQINALTSIAGDAGFNVDRTLQKLSTMHGFKNIHDVPEDRFDELKAELESAISSRKKESANG